MVSLIGGIFAAFVVTVANANGALFLGSRGNRLGGGAMNVGILDLLRKMEDVVGRDDVRYVLHRLFVQRHGWFVNGMGPAGDAWNSSSPTGILSQPSDEDVQGLFEEKLTSSGLDFHYADVLAETPGSVRVPPDRFYAGEWTTPIGSFWRAYLIWSSSEPLTMRTRST